MSTIPAKRFVSVNPSVIGAGGTALDLLGVVLTTNTRVPIGTVLSLGSALDVADYFGPGAAEAIIAGGGTGKGTGYFGGFSTSTKKPAAILFAQYPQTAVSAYLRGGNVSALTLIQLQAINGSLDITVDGYPRNAGSLNLSAATSFSSAAGIIQTALNAADPTEVTFTGSFGASFTGSGSGTNLTTTAVTGYISAGDPVSGSGVPANTKILSQTSGTPGGAGVYVTNNATTSSSASLTSTSSVVDASSLTGTLAVGQTIAGSGVTGTPVITAQLTGTAGAAGTYQTSAAAQSVASESMTAIGTVVAVTYDSVSGAFVVTSGITGTPSTVAFATGTTAASLMLTSATGALLSQGAAATTPAAFMNSLIAITQNWATFMTAFDPDGGSGNTQKLAFAAWANGTNNRFAYIAWDTDITATETVPQTGSLGYLVGPSGSNYSGTAVIYEPSDLNLASFVCGAVASIDFTRTNGRITLAYKGQNGLLASATTDQVALNLGGDPQTPGSFGNGYNYYGAVGTASAQFSWFQRGTISGPFQWIDSYVNQIALNSAFQLALLNFLSVINSVPFNDAGNTMIEEVLAAPIQQFLSFGAYGPGTISTEQITDVNAQAGTDISVPLQTQGWYLQILPASSTTRASRSSPPITFWYLDRGSVQALNLASVAVQ